MGLGCHTGVEVYGKCEIFFILFFLQNVNLKYELLCNAVLSFFL